MPHRRLTTVLLTLAAGALPACQQRMASQPSARPDQPSTFFEDGRAARPVVAGTIARGHLRTDLHLFAGRVSPERDVAALPAAILGAGAADPRALPAVALAAEGPPPVDTFPFPITEKVLRHGRNRYMIYCVVCHDPLGTGHGMIVQRGYTEPPSYHIKRLREAPVGHFYEVMTMGYGSMPDYRQQVPPRDRWAIAAYIRALQLSRHFPAKELTGEMRTAWQRQKDGGAAP